MTVNIDLTQPYAQVGGREPLKYLQHGCGFDREMNYIGRFTDNGEPLGQAKALYAQADEAEGSVTDEPAADETAERRKPGRPKKAP